jgi:hypothetical protein
VATKKLPSSFSPTAIVALSAAAPASISARPTPPPVAAHPAQAPQAVEADTGPDEDPDDDVLASLTRR